MASYSPKISQASLQFIKNQIDELERLDRKSCSVEDLKSRISELMEGYACFTIIIDAEYVYRARRNSHEQLFTNIIQLGCPPPDQTRNHGRLNRAGTSMFYVSASENTAILEMRPKAGDVLTVLKCKLKNPNSKPHVMELGLLEKTSQHKIPTTTNLLENTLTGKTFFGNRENIEKNLTIRSFLAKEFTRIVERGDEHEFKVTVAIAEILLSSDRIDGVEYPSIAGDVSNWKGGANMALKPSSADRLYKAEACWVLEIEKEIGESSNKGFVVHCIHREKSISSDGEIIW